MRGGNDVKYQEIVDDLRSIENLKTKDVDKYNKKLIKEKADVSDLKEYVLKDSLVHRTYFQVSMGKLKTYEEQFKFVEDNCDLLQDWWHVDQLTQFIKKPVDFDYAFAKAKEYIVSEKTFMRRWGYVLFLVGLQKDVSHTKDILSLMKDDNEYYVQMAEAWLICDLAVFNVDEVMKFTEKTKIKYNIMGKTVQKICDSFRFTAEEKEFFKSMREKLKANDTK